MGYPVRSMADARDIRQHLESLVTGAVRAAVAAGELPDVALPGATIERPKDAANGDYASSLPLRLARAAMKPPLTIAVKSMALAVLAVVRRRLSSVTLPEKAVAL